MKKASIHIYRVLLATGNTAFESKENDDSTTSAAGNLKTLAGIIKGQVDYYLKDNGYGQVAIEFIPLHGMECPAKLVPRLCKALTEAEIQEFWEHFKAQK